MFYWVYEVFADGAYECVRYFRVIRGYVFDVLAAKFMFMAGAVAMYFTLVV